MKVSVFGLGKLGAPLAVLLAAKGHDVVGVDVSEQPAAMLSAGTAPVDEPGLQGLLDTCRPRLRATTDAVDAVGATDLTYVIVPTPTDPTGGFSNRFVESALEAIGAGLRAKGTYHVVVVTSTVMPGATMGALREALERASGRTVGIDVGLCYSPEFIALGSVLDDMRRPDVVLIGESDPVAGAMVEAVALSVVENDPVVQRMNTVNAELVKIAINTFVTTKISYANMLSELCDRLPGAAADVVVRAVGADSRIGGRYLRPATAYGGPCFPRDNVAFTALARSLGVEPAIPAATDTVNRRQGERLARLVASTAQPPATVAVLGLSYKPGTPVIDESAGVDLAARLATAGYDVVVHDPRAMDAALAVLRDAVRPAATTADAVRGADVVVVTTPWPEYADLDASQLRADRTAAVIDCWGVVDPRACGPNACVVRPGTGVTLSRPAAAVPPRPAPAQPRVFQGTDTGGLVVVAGAGGFIGGWLVRDLQRQGHDRIRAIDVKPLDQWHQRFDGVENLVMDLRREDTCRRAVRGAHCVYNLAADMGGMGFIEAHKADCMVSVLINTNLLLATRDARPARYFYASSACVYAAEHQTVTDVRPLREEDAYPAMPEDGYGWEKLFSERMCRHFHEDYGIATRVARYHNVYGPEGTWQGGREKAPAALSRKVAEAVLSGAHHIDIWGDGEQTRSFMFIDDCVYGTQRLTWSDVTEPLNIGSSELVSVNGLVDLLEEIAGVRLERRYQLDAPKGVRGRNSDNTRALALLQWEPSIRLRDGMERTYRWVYDQVATGRDRRHAMAR